MDKISEVEEPPATAEPAGAPRPDSSEASLRPSDTERRDDPTPATEADDPDPDDGIPEWLTAGRLARICAVLLVVILLRAFVLEVYVVVGDSMDPVLRNREQLLINKLGISEGGLDRFDIVVFTHPDAPRRHLIKRVVALPGETISLRAGRAYLKVGKDRERELAMPWLDPVQLDPSVNDADYEVPAGFVYVLGDNRLNSKDSREFGAIPMGAVVGTAVFRIWPLSRIGRLTTD